ncbi:hypothetical protein P4114_05095 [Pseudomonas aeruginosa]|nr:hypothetical protein [Pseudomonas aeruginosa]
MQPVDGAAGAVGGEGGVGGQGGEGEGEAEDQEAFMTVTPSGLSIALESFSVRISRFKNEVR